MEKWILILIPTYIFYVVVLLTYMFWRRLRAVRAKEVSFGYFRSYKSGAAAGASADVPTELLVLQNHFSNQFEIPVFFMITCLAAVMQSRGFSLEAQTSGASESKLRVVFVLGVLFILSRLAHSAVHLGKNDVKKRGAFYVVGILLVFAMWGVIL